jgi:hypothetical protein
MVIWWDGWFLALENKIQASSIEKGQLQHQYNNPAQIARNEESPNWDDFPHSHASRRRVRVYQWVNHPGGRRQSPLSWEDILLWVDQISCDASDVSDDNVLGFQNLTKSGGARVRELLRGTERSVDASSQVAYDALKELKKQVWQRIEEGARSFAFSQPLIQQPWFDRQRSYINLDCKLAGIKRRSVQLTVYADLPPQDAQGQHHRALATHGKVALYLEKSAESTKKQAWSATIQDLSKEAARHTHLPTCKTGGVPWNSSSVLTRTMARPTPSAWLPECWHSCSHFVQSSSHNLLQARTISPDWPDQPPARKHAPPFASTQSEQPYTRTARPARLPGP